MKIVLAIIKDETGTAVEETFSQPIITIGRDAGRMDISVDNQAFRMVSRHHADIRFSKGQWMVGDMGSTYGTFLDGVQIEKPAPLKVGSAIQFGLGGPKAFVIWLDATSEMSRPSGESGTKQASPVDQHTPVPAPPPSVPNIDKSVVHSAPSIPKPSVSVPRDSKPEDLAANQASPTGTVNVEVEYKGVKKNYPLNGSNFVVGRDPNCDITIEASAVMVSRIHAEIKHDGGQWLIRDNQSFNGTLLNESRISDVSPIFDGDRVRLGHGGPVLTFSLSAKRPIEKANGKEEAAGKFAGTMVFNMPTTGVRTESGERRLLHQTDFGERGEIVVGRSNDSDITLDGLQISNRHARFLSRNGSFSVEDLNSTNGVYLNGERISRSTIDDQDSVQIGSFVFELSGYNEICVYDTRSRTRIDAKSITKQVKNRNGSGKIKLLDDISISIAPNEFVGLLGPSGAGKSTFIDALNGTRPPTYGSVLVNGLDFYRHIDHLKQNVGYVPQSEIIHEELTVEKTLYYIAKLRLSRDVSKSEINQIINEVLDVCGLNERRGVPVYQLSGGQKKRVAIAVELITKPSVIFLDEPTSGLDPTTEERIMKLFRQIAESGRTVILTTHAMENVRLFDKIVILMRGKLVFYGSPMEALSHFEVSTFKELFDRLEESVESEVLEQGESQRAVVTEKEALRLRDRFAETPQFERNIRQPLAEIEVEQKKPATRRNRLGILGAIRQWATLSRRYASVLAKDKFNLLILFAQAPVIAFLVFLVMGSEFPRDFAYFALSLCAIWFGTSVASREIVRERKIYERERMVNLGILPYLASKYTILGLIVGLQCLLLFIPLKFFDLIGVMPMPGFLLGIPHLFTVLVTAAVGITLGLFVSSVVRTSETATSLIPLILIPQIVFSGLIGVPTGISKVVGLTMPATWSFDTMKRFSTLDTLEDEGAFEDGRGLYSRIKEDNEKLMEDSRKEIKDYEQKIESSIKDAEKRVNRGESVTFQGLPERPEIGSAKNLPDDLSNYITFLHPWLNEFVSLFVLMLMSFSLFVGTVFVLKLQDSFNHE